MITKPGQSYPLGSTVFPDGVNFSVYSKNCKAVELLLFDRIDDPEPTQVIQLDPDQNRTFHYCHVFVPGLKAGQLYGYRVHGPFDPANGKRFDPSKVLIDPYARSVAIPENYNRQELSKQTDTSHVDTSGSMKSVVVDLEDYDWEDDRPPNHRFSKTVIYELHVRGFTRHPSSDVPLDRRGTYSGLIEKIPYLKELGITAVELLPIFQFDPQDAPEGMLNYWGYNPISFFAPHAAYSRHEAPLDVINEFRDMVKAFHKADIEVILDVVYNHTSEGNEDGPTFSYKGFENEAYYILESDKRRYANYSGTGNTLNGNHSVVRRLILDSLRYWVEEMHVDGFRFDLASVLSRDIKGHPLADPPILWDIETDPVLSRVKLIAEAWDAAGLYQVGRFFGDRWKDWNGQFRDDVRAFVKSDPGLSKNLANRFLASPDIYAHRRREPEQSINFITCHDGFTLNDLVSYNQKHNLDNNEGNRDGHNHNLSWNCGVEGPSDDPAIESLRKRQIKNFFAINLLALGTPMLLMGDEVRRTQNGNNNAYCHDNELTWLDWSLFEKHADIFRFVKYMIHFRLSLPVRDNRFLSLVELLQQTQIEWHGIKLFDPDWSDSSRTLSFSVVGKRNRFQIMLNSYWEPLDFEIPPHQDSKVVWRRIIDTSLNSPDDFCEPADAPLISTKTYRMQPRSLVLLSTNFTNLILNGDRQRPSS